jgi:hypothetical protein
VILLDLPASDPGRYSFEIGVMKEMGWSWRDLCAAPPDLIDEIAHKAMVRSRFQDERRRKDEQLQKAKKVGR